MADQIATSGLSGMVREPAHQWAADLAYLHQVNRCWDISAGSTANKLEAFTKYASRQSLTKFITRCELFRMQLDVHGSIVEVGVHRGASLMARVDRAINAIRRIPDIVCHRGGQVTSAMINRERRKQELGRA